MGNACSGKGDAVEEFVGGPQLKEGSFTIYYHGACTEFWGRAYPIVLTLASKQRDCVFKGSTEATGDPYPAGFVNLPAITFPGEGGVSMAQLPAILITLTHALKAAPINHPVFGPKHTQLILDANDMFTELCQGKDKKRFDAWFSYLDTTLCTLRPAGPGSSYLLKTEMATPADFFMFWTMLWIQKRAADEDEPAFAKKEEYASLQLWFSAMEKDPVVRLVDSGEMSGGKAVPRIPDVRPWKK